jgi:hypothetical protein
MRTKPTKKNAQRSARKDNNIRLRNIPDDLHSVIKKEAEKESNKLGFHVSMENFVIHFLKKHLKV